MDVPSDILKVDTGRSMGLVPRMIAAIPFPDISPEILTIEFGGFGFSLRWYALAYIVGILIGWRLAVAAVRRHHLWPNETAPLTPDAIEDLLTAIILGVILGGRIGYALVYQPDYYLAHPLQILAVWQGGMAFHGGMLGVAAAAAWFSWRRGVPIMSLLDILAIATPAGLLLGRIANFINAELWGAPTTLPWGVIFPGPAAQDCPGITGPCARHPTQLYEAGLEGLLLGVIILWLAFGRRWLKWPGTITGVFLAGYGLARMLVEIWRQSDAQFITPDNPQGYIIDIGTVGLSMGQLLSFPMVLLGLTFILAGSRRRQTP